MKIRRYVPASRQTFQERIRQAAADRAEALRDPDIFRDVLVQAQARPVVRLRFKARR